MNLVIVTPEGYINQVHPCVTIIPSVGHGVLVELKEEEHRRFTLVVNSVLFDYENNQVITNVE